MTQETMMPLHPLSPPPAPEPPAPPARRPRLLGRGLFWAGAITAFIVALAAAGLFLLPHAADVQRLPSALHWMPPMFAVLYAVALALVWVRGVSFLDWLAKSRGLKPVPREVARTVRNRWAALIALMLLTVLLRGFSEGAR